MNYKLSRPAKLRIMKLWRWMFKSRCPKCKTYSVTHIGTDYVGMADIEVYECNKCKTEFY